MRIGVVGVGRHATAALLPNIAPAGLELWATCARHLDRAEISADRWGAKRAFNNVEHMLSDSELQGVIVCVPPEHYGSVIRLCIEAKLPVFCEKPGAASSAEAIELAYLASIADVPIVVGYMKRFAPSYTRARELMKTSAFGAPSMGAFTFAMGQGFNNDLRSYIIDNPVHHLDLARYLFGDVTHLEAAVTELPGFGHAVGALGRTESGAVCTFNLCTTASWEQRNEHVEIFGRGHSIWLDNVDTCVYRPPDRPESVWRPNYTVATANNLSATIMGFLPELVHYRQVANHEAENQSDMNSAAATLALAEKLCEIADVGGRADFGHDQRGG